MSEIPDNPVFWDLADERLVNVGHWEYQVSACNSWGMFISHKIYYFSSYYYYVLIKKLNIFIMFNKYVVLVQINIS